MADDNASTPVDAPPDTPPQLKTRKLGKSGLRVSDLSLGCMTFSTYDEDHTGINGMGMGITHKVASYEMLDAYVAAGGNFLDTADAYEESENLVGMWLAEREAERAGFREELVIATKFFFPTAGGRNGARASRKHVIAACNASLQRMGIDYIDLFQLHCFDHVTPLEETLAALNHLIDQGKIHYIGVSNFTGWQLQKAVDISAANGWAPITSCQIQYNLDCRAVEWELMDVCANEGVGVMAWSPLAGGLLTGRYSRDAEVPEGSRQAWKLKMGFDTEDTLRRNRLWDTIDVLKELAQAYDSTPAQVALRWTMQRSELVVPIVGARKIEHLNDNLRASFFELTDDDMTRLNEASNEAAPYPYSFINRFAQAPF